MMDRLASKLLTISGLSLFAVLGYYVVNLPMPLDGPRYQGIGAFELVDQDGRRVTSDDFGGRPVVLSFGSTGCNDRNEARLGDISTVIQKLDASSLQRLQFVFVGVDSERDSPKTMKDFLAAFDRRFVGLTGTKSQIQKMTGPYPPHYKKLPDGLGGYRIRHPSGIFLYNSDGELVEVFTVSQPIASLGSKLGALAQM